MLINSSGVVEIVSGFSTFDIESDNDLNLTFDIEDNSNCFFRIKKAKKINIQAEIKHKVELFFWNDDKDSIELEEHYNVTDNGDFSISYGECNMGNTNRKTEIRLSDNNVKASLSSSSLVSSKKNYQIKLINIGKNTIGNINNYAVVLEKGRLMIDAIGQIKNGASGSESHQVSRALSFEEGQNTTILPELLIDENDVKASHAMSIGRMDENQLYYLTSRGLSIKECTMLVSIGYLTPIVDQIKDDELKETLRNELERKIREICLM